MRKNSTLGLTGLCVVSVMTYAEEKPQPAATRDPIRVACVGDSITYGHSVKNRQQNSYPAQLGRLLGSGWEVGNYGHNGVTMLKDGGRPMWDQPEFAAAQAFEPDMVVIALGTNDAADQRWAADWETMRASYARDCRAMVNTFRQLPSRPKVWLCRAVPLIAGRSDDRMRNLETEIFPIIDDVAQELDVDIIDLHRALSGHPEFYEDRVHPYASGARLMAREVYRALTRKEPPSPPTRELGTIIAFGDSTTAFRKNMVVYSQILQRELGDDGLQARVLNAGIGGDDTRKARKRFERDVISKHPSIVILQFGINDALVNVDMDPSVTTPRVSLAEYEANLRFMTGQLKDHGVTVVLMTPNPLRWAARFRRLYGKPPYQPDEELGFEAPLRNYIKTVRRLAQELNVALLDVHAEFNLYSRAATQSVDDLLLDGMHPNGMGHRLIAYRLRELLESLPTPAISDVDRRTTAQPSTP